MLDVDLIEFALGGGIIAIAGLLAGVSGFGFALVSAPLLLLLGFPLEFVVTVNITLALLMRIWVTYLLWKHISLQRVSKMILGSLPGSYLGAKILASVDTSALEFVAGILVVAFALHLNRSIETPPPHSTMPGAALLAGFTGGFLGTATSLGGVPPVLLLAHEKVAPLRFIATLAVYFVVASTIALILLAAQGVLATQALFPISLLWLPGALLGNTIGIKLAPRLPEKLFRQLTLAIMFAAGSILVISQASKIL